MRQRQKKEPSYFLDECDALRDEVLPNLGVKVVDDAEFDYYLVDKHQLLEDIANKKKDQKNALIQKKQTSLP